MTDIPTKFHENLLLSSEFIAAYIHIHHITFTDMQTMAQSYKLPFPLEIRLKTRLHMILLYILKTL